MSGFWSIDDILDDYIEHKHGGFSHVCGSDCPEWEQARSDWRHEYNQKSHAVEMEATERLAKLNRGEK